MTAGSDSIVFDDATLDAFCRRHHIARLALFGSHLHGTATADSDVDLLVEFEDGHVPGLIAISTMEIALSRMLDGRTVDLRTLGESFAVAGAWGWRDVQGGEPWRREPKAVCPSLSKFARDAGPGYRARRLTPT